MKTTDACGEARRKLANSTNIDTLASVMLVGLTVISSRQGECSSKNLINPISTGIPDTSLNFTVFNSCNVASSNAFLSQNCKSSGSTFVREAVETYIHL